MKNEVASNVMHDQAIDAFLADILQMKVMIHDKMNAISTNNIFRPHDFIVKNIYDNVYVYF